MLKRRRSMEVNERTLLSCFLQSRDAYDAVVSRVDRDRDLTEQGRILFDSLLEYYERDPEARRVDPELFKEQVALSVANPKHKEMFANIAQELCQKDDVSPSNILDVFYRLRRETLAHQIASALMSDPDSKDTLGMMEEYENMSSHIDVEEDYKSDECFSGESIESILQSREASGLIKILPRVLNDKLKGGCLPGHHIVLFGRPEIGKTATLINMVYGFVRQNKKVLYIGNEDPLPDILMRCITRLSDMTEEEVLANPREADNRARERGYENLVLVSLSPGTPSDVERLAKEHKPDVICIDQLRNLHTNSDNQTQSMERAARMVRQTGKRHGALVVSVTQAGDSATGKSILNMGDVDMSNTGVPAQADVMVAVGANQNEIDSNRLVLSLPKNKRSGDHSYCMVTVDHSRSKLMSLQ